MKKLQLHNANFNQRLHDFVKRVNDQGVSNSGKQSLVNHTKEFLHFMEDRGLEYVSKITQKAIEDYFEYLQYRPNQRRGGGLHTNTINKHRESVLRFMEFLTDTKTGESGFYIRHLKPTPEVKEILTLEEVKAIYEATDNTLAGITDRCILSLLYGCGLRKREMYNLEVTDIDLVRGVIRLDNTKTKHQRDVVMSPKVQNCLEEYLYTAREIMLPPTVNVTHVVVTDRGRRMTLPTIHFRVKRMVKRAGIEKNVTAHGFRHSIATHMLGDLTLEEVGEFLGHKHLDSTQIYTHLKETL